MVLGRSDICQVKCQEQGSTDDRKGLQLGNSKGPRKLSHGPEWPCTGVRQALLHPHRSPVGSTEPERWGMRTGYESTGTDEKSLEEGPTSLSHSSPTVGYRTWVPSTEVKQN